VKTTSLSALSHAALLLKWDAMLAQDSTHLAELLAVLGEVNARKLYLPAGYPSMYVYCIEAKHMSEDVAFKRIRAARTARRYPIILREIAHGRLHLTGVVLLSKYLKPGNAAELLAAAVHKSRAEIVKLLADRFPQPDLPSRFAPLSTPVAAEQIHSMAPVPGRVDSMPLADSVPIGPPIPMAMSGPPCQVTPLAPERFGFQTTIGRRVHDKLREAQELLSHQVAPNDLEDLLESLLDLSLPQLRKQKHAATHMPQPQKPRRSSDPRYIPNAVKQAVWARDEGQCTFRSENGQRCPSRTRIEYDHIDPVARGGDSTAQNIRLRCRAHNQYEAEKIFGAEFMSAKRERCSQSAASIA